MGNRELLGRHEGKRCFVIGNGPSLNRLDLGVLKDEITFAASGFWKHPVIKIWEPTYYCFADPLFFDGTEAMDQFFELLRQHITDSEFFVPYDGRVVIESHGLLPVEKLHYVKFHGSLEHGDLADVDLAGPIPSVINVMQLAIMAALYMKCSPIYLIGLDHDWLSHRGEDSHFYRGPTIDGHTIASDLSLEKYSYKYLMQCQLTLWNGYENIKSYSESQGTKIINATNGGFLDVFPRARYADLF